MKGTATQIPQAVFVVKPMHAPISTSLERYGGRGGTLEPRDVRATATSSWSS